MFESAIIERPEVVAEGPSAVVQAAVMTLRPHPQLRLGDLNRDHLSVIALADGDWPPIVVKRSDNTIIDGHYRYLAAQQLGHSHIACVYFDGGDEAAFVEALHRNRHHGLPLSLPERQRAAGRLLESHPDWSHRRIAELCSLAPGTVARLRAAAPLSPAAREPGPLRLGKDGRRRPSNPGAARDRVLRVLETQPDRSLREIARMAGTSPATVRAAKNTIAAGSKPANLSSRAKDEPAGRGPGLDRSHRWASDSALLSTVEGTGFAKWFDRTDIGDEPRDFVSGIPISRIYEVADEARRRAAAWLAFASLLEGRAKGNTLCV
jgi:ParB-like chromosome segregation protein Spo0J